MIFSFSLIYSSFDTMLLDFSMHYYIFILRCFYLLVNIHVGMSDDLLLSLFLHYFDLHIFLDEA